MEILKQWFKQDRHCIASNIQQLLDVFRAACLQQCQPCGSPPADICCTEHALQHFNLATEHHVEWSEPLKDMREDSEHHGTETYHSANCNFHRRICIYVYNTIKVVNNNQL
jgi:hypothetical protein